MGDSNAVDVDGLRHRVEERTGPARRRCSNGVLEHRSAPERVAAHGLKERWVPRDRRVRSGLLCRDRLEGLKDRRHHREAAVVVEERSETGVDNGLTLRLAGVRRGVDGEDGVVTGSTARFADEAVHRRLPRRMGTAEAREYTR